jgi:hypothetical protein
MNKHQNSSVILALLAIILSLCISCDQRKNNRPSMTPENTEAQNLLEKRHQLADAERKLDILFDGIASKLFTIQKNGALSLSYDDSGTSEKVGIYLPLKVTFNQIQYAAFKNSLCGILKPVCIRERTGAVTKDVLDEFENQKSESFPWDANEYTITFIDVDDNENGSYTSYSIPTLLIRKIFLGIEPNYLSKPCVLFEFNTTDGKAQRGVCYEDYDIPGNMEGKCKAEELRFHVRGRTSLIFFNHMMNNNSPRSLFTSKEYTQELRVFEKTLQNLQSCNISMLSGTGADFAEALRDGNTKYIQKLADKEYYVPAMLVLAENEGNKRYYHMAALLGNSTAQAKTGWKNAGLGLAIAYDSNGQYIVQSVQAGLPVEEGAIITTIAGKELKDMKPADVSELLGSYKPGKKVTLKFTDGKKVRLQFLLP